MGSIVIDDYDGTDGIDRTANLPAFSAFTAAGWAKVTDTTQASTQWLVQLGVTSGSNAALIFGADGTMYVFADSGSDAFGSAPTSATWVYVAITSDGSETIGYWWPDNSGSLGTVTTVTRAVVGTGTTTHLRVGGRYSVDQRCPGKYAYWKVWDRALTQANIEAEAYSPTFVSTTNANCGFADSATDIGPNSRDWTLTGTTTDSDTPPVTSATPRMALLGVG